MLTHGAGPPSTPTLSVGAVDHGTAILTISPPSHAGQCVLNYTITATSSDGSVVPDITVEVTERGAPVQVLQSGLDLRSNTYSFRAVGTTFQSTTEQSEIVVLTVAIGDVLCKFLMHVTMGPKHMCRNEFLFKGGGHQPNPFLCWYINWGCPQCLQFLYL